MIMNVDTVRGMNMELKNLSFDEIVSEYTTMRYRAYFYISGHECIYTDWYYGGDGMEAVQALCDIVRKSGDSVACIQSQQVVVAKAVRIDGDIENEE